MIYLKKKKSKKLRRILKFHYGIMAFLQTQTFAWWFSSACICLRERNGRKKQEAVRVEGYKNKARSRYAEELLLDSASLAVLSECKGITGKISGRTAVWSTMPSEKNSLGLWINALCVSGSALPCLCLIQPAFYPLSAAFYIHTSAIPWQCRIT